MQTDTRGSLKDRFNDFGAAPSDALWDSIAASLDEDKKNRGTFWWWLMGSAAAIALVVLIYRAGYKAGVSEGGQTSPMAKAGQVESTVEQHIIASDKTVIDENGRDDLRQHDDITTLPNPSTDRSATDQHDGLYTAAPEKENFVETFVPGNEAEQPANRIEEDQLAGTIPLQKVSPAKISRLSNSIKDPFLPSTSAVGIFPRIVPEWEVGLNVGTAFRSPVAYKMDNENFDNTADTGSLTSTPTFVGWPEPYQAKLSRPLTVELSLGRSIGRRWTIQTGLAFAVSRSIAYYNPNPEGLNKVRYRYLAFHLPVHIAYDYVKRRRVECYAALGVNNEFPFHTRSTPVYEQTLMPAFDTEEKKQMKFGYQGSVQVSAGFRYGLNEHLKLDLRPNLRYYFRAENAVIPDVPQRFWPGFSGGLTWVF